MSDKSCSLCQNYRREQVGPTSGRDIARCINAIFQRSSTAIFTNPNRVFTSMRTSAGRLEKAGR